jgi:hypothetical protein
MLIPTIILPARCLVKLLGMALASASLSSLDLLRTGAFDIFVSIFRFEAPVCRAAVVSIKKSLGNAE